MIELSIAVTMSDGRSDTYPVTPRVQVDFERHFKTSLISAMSDAAMEHVYWLGWAAMKQSGEVVKLFDEWLNMVDRVELDAGGSPPLG